MAWTHTFAFPCFREQIIDTYNQQNGADSGLSGGSGNDRFTNTISPVKNLVSTTREFKDGAQFGAWLGLTPKQNSSGGKNNLGSITKRGDMYVRMLLIQGAKSAVMTAHKRDDPISKWAHQLREKSGWQKAAVALANKNARILWAMFVRGKPFDARHVSVKPGQPAAVMPVAMAMATALA